MRHTDKELSYFASFRSSYFSLFFFLSIKHLNWKKFKCCENRRPQDATKKMAKMQDEEEEEEATAAMSPMRGSVAYTERTVCRFERELRCHSARSIRIPVHHVLTSFQQFICSVRRAAELHSEQIADMRPNQCRRNPHHQWIRRKIPIPWIGREINDAERCDYSNE